jgi:RNA polymerase sigma-70 factor (TIGR02952 family)
MLVSRWREAVARYLARRAADRFPPRSWLLLPGAAGLSLAPAGAAPSSLPPVVLPWAGGLVTRNRDHAAAETRTVATRKRKVPITLPADLGVVPNGKGPSGLLSPPSELPTADVSLDELLAELPVAEVAEPPVAESAELAVAETAELPVVETAELPVVETAELPVPEAQTAELPVADAAGMDVVEDAIEDDHAETWHLVTLAQGGDGEAFGQLYDKYVDAVYRYLYYRVGDRGLAEDFTSETFLRALRRIGRLEYQGRDVGAWFMTIARNLVLDHAKSARNRFEVVTDEPIEGRNAVVSTESTVLANLTSQELVTAVNQLGTEQRECIVLRFIQGLSVSETAAVMGKGDGAIKALQHRAVRRLVLLLGGSR